MENRLQNSDTDKNEDNLWSFNGKSSVVTLVSEVYTMLYHNSSNIIIIIVWGWGVSDWSTSINVLYESHLGYIHTPTADLSACAYNNIILNNLSC